MLTVASQAVQDSAAVTTALLANTMLMHRDVIIHTAGQNLSKLICPLLSWLNQTKFKLKKNKHK